MMEKNVYPRILLFIFNSDLWVLKGKYLIPRVYIGIIDTGILL